MAFLQTVTTALFSNTNEVALAAAVNTALDSINQENIMDIQYDVIVDPVGGTPQYNCLIVYKIDN